MNVGKVTRCTAPRLWMFLSVISQILFHSPGCARAFGRFLSAQNMVSCHRSSTPRPFNSPLWWVGLKKKKPHKSPSSQLAGQRYRSQTTHKYINGHSRCRFFFLRCCGGGDCVLTRKPQAFSSCTVMSHAHVRARALRHLMSGSAQESRRCARIRSSMQAMLLGFLVFPPKRFMLMKFTWRSWLGKVYAH